MRIILNYGKFFISSFIFVYIRHITASTLDDLMF